jgi:PAS domain S-box-containing protein
MSVDHAIAMFIMMLVAQIPLLVAAYISYLKGKENSLKIDANTKQQDGIAKSVEDVRNVVNGAAHHALITSDMDGTIIDTTDEVYHLTGYQPSELVGKNVSILLPHRYIKRHEAAVLASKLGGAIRPDDVAILGHLKSKTGAEIPIIVCLVQSGGNRVTAQLVLRSELLTIDDGRINKGKLR